MATRAALSAPASAAAAPPAGAGAGLATRSRKLVWNSSVTAGPDLPPGPARAACLAEARRRQTRAGSLARGSAWLLLAPALADMGRQRVHQEGQRLLLRAPLCGDVVLDGRGDPLP